VCGNYYYSLHKALTNILALAVREICRTSSILPPRIQPRSQARIPKARNSPLFLFYFFPLSTVLQSPFGPPSDGNSSSLQARPSPTLPRELTHAIIWLIKMFSKGPGDFPWLVCPHFNLHCGLLPLFSNVHRHVPILSRHPPCSRNFMAGRRRMRFPPPDLPLIAVLTKISQVDRRQEFDHPYPVICCGLTRSLQRSAPLSLARSHLAPT